MFGSVELVEGTTMKASFIKNRIRFSSMAITVISLATNASVFLFSNLAYGTGISELPAGTYAEGYQDTAHDAANKTSNSAVGSALLQIGLGGVLLYTAKPFESSCWTSGVSCPMAAFLVAQGAISLSQATADSSAANYNNGIKSSLNNGSSNSNSGSAQSVNALIENTNGLSDQEKLDLKNNYQKAIADTSGRYNLDKGTFVAPDGKSHNMSDMQTASDFESAGFSKKDAATMASAMSTAVAKAREKASKLSFDTNVVSTDDGANGSGSGLSAKGDRSSDASRLGMGSSGKGLGAANSTRDPAALVAGMSKSFNGELIGVSGDSIFGMMNRRYKLKENQDSFFSEAELMTRGK